MLKLLDQNAEKWALLVFYSMLVVTMAIEVIRREVFAYSSIWGEEIVRYCFIYLAWIGAAAAVKERAHIRIDVIFNYLSHRAKALLYIFGDDGGCSHCLFLFLGNGCSSLEIRFCQSWTKSFNGLVPDGRSHWLCPDDISACAISHS